MKRIRQKSLLVLATCLALGLGACQKAEDGPAEPQTLGVEEEAAADQGRIKVENEDGIGYEHKDLEASSSALEVMVQHLDQLKDQVGSTGYQLQGDDGPSLVNTYHLLEENLGPSYSVEILEEVGPDLVVSCLNQSQDFETILEDLLPFVKKSLGEGYDNIYLNIFGYGYFQLPADKVRAFEEEGKLDIDHLGQLHQQDARLEVY